MNTEKGFLIKSPGSELRTYSIQFSCSATKLS